MNVQKFGSHRTIRVVVTNPTNHSHPMHLHGHSMFILQKGIGTWDGTIVNPHNPQRRDVQVLPANGYTVWQINADNPGVWPYHCHVVWHNSAGLSHEFSGAAPGHQKFTEDPHDHGPDVY
jgi:FtsP/CotA-like multicopper oxidase with cupredoxin domain